MCIIEKCRHDVDVLESRFFCRKHCKHRPRFMQNKLPVTSWEKFITTCLANLEKYNL